MIVVQTDPVVTQAVARALTTVRANDHMIAGLLDLAPRPLAQGVCVRCGGRLTVAYTAGSGGGPLADYGSLTGPCRSSGAWIIQADASESLRPLALRVRQDPRFLAHPLHLYAARHGLDERQVASRLEVSAAALLRLFLHPAPPVPLAAPTDDVAAGNRALLSYTRDVASTTGVNPDQLAAVLEDARGLVATDERGRQERERAALIEETRRERDQYARLLHQAQERLDALTAARTGG